MVTKTTAVLLDTVHSFWSAKVAECFLFPPKGPISFDWLIGFMSRDRDRAAIKIQWWIRRLIVVNSSGIAVSRERVLSRLDRITNRLIF